MARRWQFEDLAPRQWGLAAGEEGLLIHGRMSGQAAQDSESLSGPRFRLETALA